MIGTKPAGIFSDRGGEAAVAEFIRTKGVTRCPTACVLPTQAAVAAADRAALREYAAAREQVRRARAAARQNSFFPVVF
jgi:7-keto-8-aminopelargonate synthetase-like enzyme